MSNQLETNHHAFYLALADLLGNFNTAKVRTKLRGQPDYKAVNRLLVQTHQQIVVTDKLTS
jgi:hypothetical protein